MLNKIFPNIDQHSLQFLEKKTFKKGDFLLQEGKICRYIYFIETGCCRLFYYDEDKDITAWFSFENDTVTSTSFFGQKPSHQMIQALEDSVVWSISHSDLQILFNQNPQIERFARLTQEQIIIQLDERLRSLQFKTAKERFNHLLELFPSIFLRVPHHYIASYLGITSETLSRMRSSF